MLAPKFAAELDSKWDAQKAKLKSHFPQLTDDDLAYDRSKKIELLVSLQAKLGKTVREIQNIMETQE